MIEPLKHRLIVQRDSPPKETTSGIYIPDQAQRKETVGTILAVGKDADESLKIGQRVAFGIHDGTDVKSEHCDNLERCILIPDSQILYIIGDNS